MANKSKKNVNTMPKDSKDFPQHAKINKIVSLFFLILLLMGCTNFIKFEKDPLVKTGFHKINIAEKTNNGILYYNGDKVIYEENDKIEIASNVKSLWRENNDIYYVNDNILYIYNIESKTAKKLVDKPYNILGKYNDSIISYSGKTIYSIKGNKKTKLFKDGYYLNRAILYKNKVYGIPATNVYEYNLDTLSVKKITKNTKYSYIKLINDELWIVTKNKNNYTYSKIVNDNIKKMFTIKKVESVTDELNIKNGMVIKTSKSFNESVKGNRLLYIYDDKIKMIDKNHDYEVIGIYNNKLCYYKNNFMYGTEQKNLKTFYLYDGKNSKKAFDLDVNYYEDIKGYEYDTGLLIEILYENSTELYKYDGVNITKMKLPSHIHRINGIDIIENKAYIKYTDGEESLYSLGMIIELYEK